MQVIPSKRYAFELIDSREEALNRLRKRTHSSKLNISMNTDKSLIGTIQGNKFKVNSSFPGIGAFCVMSGAMDSKFGYVNVEINKVFRILIYLFFVLPFIMIIPPLFEKDFEFSVMLIIGPIIMLAFWRFLFVEIAFRFSASEGLKRLRDILNVDIIKD